MRWIFNNKGMLTQKNVALEFNDFSKNYTNDMIGCVPYYLEQVSNFTTHLPDNFKPNHILDLGCGNGNITAQLISQFPNATFTLVDASSEMIELCSNQFKSYDVTYVNSYFKDFEFMPDHYDLVVAGFSLHHCDAIEKQSIFKEIYKTLRKGGIFSCSDLMIDKNSSDHPAMLESWNKFVNGNFPSGEKWNWLTEHYAAFDKPSEYWLQIDWLKQVGFTTITTPFNKNHWIFLQAVK